MCKARESKISIILVYTLSNNQFHCLSTHINYPRKKYNPKTILLVYIYTYTYIHINATYFNKGNHRKSKKVKQKTYLFVITWVKRDVKIDLCS